MPLPPVRIGFVGAGGIVRLRHVPGLSAIEGVELVAVSNRGRASSTRFAQEFGVRQVVDDWRELVRRPDIDVVWIGTWPYLHQAVSVAALEAGKHVFCQARMAMDLSEAQAMLAAARRRPRIVHRVCPPPHRMPLEPWIKRTLWDGTLGEIREVRLTVCNGSNLGPLSWRERAEYSGKQVMQVGIWAETLNAWLGEYDTLTATLATPVAAKPDPEHGGAMHKVGVAQVVNVSGTLAGALAGASGAEAPGTAPGTAPGSAPGLPALRGVAISEHHSGVSLGEAVNELRVIGSKAVLRVSIGTGTESSNTVELIRDGKAERVDPTSLPAEERNPWDVEREFIDAVRRAMDGGSTASTSTSPDFAGAIGYMRKMEAIHLSAAIGRTVRMSQIPGA